MSKKFTQYRDLGGFELKQEERNGQEVGIIAGYIATWDIDRGSFGVRDQFVRGAFADSIREHQVKRRQIRLKDHHGRTVGGFPIEHVFEDEIGLYAIGEINMKVQQGEELMTLIRQGVLTDFSIGFSSVEDSVDEGLRKITKAIIWEGSVVDEPMNPKAVITEVKAAVPFQDLPLADRGYKWDVDAAIARVKEFTESEDFPQDGYKNAFLRYEKDRPSEFDSYSVPIADVIDGKLTIIPEAIFKAVESVKDNTLDGEINHIERYYAKMGLPSPFEEKQYFVSDDVKEWTPRELEKALRKSGLFSKSAAKIIANEFKSVDNKDTAPDNTKNILDSLNAIKKHLQ